MRDGDDGVVITPPCGAIVRPEPQDESAEKVVRIGLVAPSEGAGGCAQRLRHGSGARRRARPARYCRGPSRSDGRRGAVGAQGGRRRRLDAVAAVLAALTQRLARAQAGDDGFELRSRHSARDQIAVDDEGGGALQTHGHGFLHIEHQHVVDLGAVRLQVLI